jgi:hypothetical protein
LVTPRDGGVVGGRQHPTLARANQNVATMVMLLDTFPASFTDGVDKVYQQLKDLLGTTAA